MESALVSEVGPFTKTLASFIKAAGGRLGTATREFLLPHTPFAVSKSPSRATPIFRRIRVLKTRTLQFIVSGIFIEGTVGSKS